MFNNPGLPAWYPGLLKEHRVNFPDKPFNWVSRSQPLSQGGTGTLLEARPGSTVEIHCLDGISNEMKASLQAYGIGPGKTVRVLQQRPETVVEVEATELAVEREVAGKILIKTAGN